MKRLSKKTLNTFIVLLVAATLLSLSVYAWFYFPTSQNVNLATADKKDLQIRLYKMDLDGLNYRFIEEPVGSSSVINLSHTWSFFQWGDEYLIENEEEQLFALECICDTDIFESGKIKLVLDFDMVCTSDDINELVEAESCYALFQFVDISYHIIDSDITSYDITSRAASLQAQNMTDLDFTEITLTETGSTTSSSTLEGDVNYIYVDHFENNVPVNYYTQTVGAPPNTTERFRSVIIIKIKANQALVTSAMNGYANDPRTKEGFGYLSELDLINNLTLTCTLRTVPAKTE